MGVSGDAAKSYPIRNMSNFFLVASLLVSCFLLVRILALVDLKDVVLASFCFAAGFIYLWGYILSALDVLGNLSAWLAAGLATVLLLGLLAVVTKARLDLIPLMMAVRTGVADLREKIKPLHTSGKLILFLLTLSSLLAGAMNLYLVLRVAPYNWDSMISHLPRMAQYIQNNNMGYFETASWSQAIHPKGSTLIFIYLFLAFGNNENLTQLAQYVSYWIFVAAIYGISRRMGWDKPQSLFAALVASLLVSGISQANATLNDMMMAALFGTAVYFLLTFRDMGMRKYLALSALGIGLAVGVKASALSVMPSIFLFALTGTRGNGNWRTWSKNMLIFLAAVSIAVLVFALPFGYADNHRMFGNFLGNQDVRAIHSFAESSPGEVLRGGGYNVLRYGLNFLSLDGLPPIQPVLQVQQAIRSLPLKILSWAGIDLEDPIAINFFPYENDRIPAHAEAGYWGVLGFGMVWLLVAWSLFQPRKHPQRFVMALAAVVFLLAVAFSGPYDSSRGRYFSIGAVFAAPLAGMWLMERRRIVQIYLVALVALGSVSAVSAVVLKTMPPFQHDSGQVNLLQIDRLGQLTYFNFRYYRPLVRFESRVPADAVVAVYFQPNTYEYPLYGRYLTRRIISINSFRNGLLPIPAGAEYLLYARGYPCARYDDIGLGADWFLRVLEDDNRECDAE